jgi:hypothetical protein
MMDPRDPLGLEEIARAMHRLGGSRRDLLAFYLFTATLAVLALLLAAFR